jgi:D-tyrosyl-tRNA(Tyr) deacylase
MKVIIQRVSMASVTVNDHEVASIQQGLLVLVGVEPSDTADDAQKMIKKICNMRLFATSTSGFDRSLSDINGDILLVPQFTLMANCSRGRRPSFESAARPPHAKAMFHAVVDAARTMPIGLVASGVFGANMQVSLINDGPVTISLNSNNIK